MQTGSVAKKANHLGVPPSSLKLPIITSIAYSTARSKDWDDVVTTHAGEAKGRSWSVEGKRVGKWTMPSNSEAKVGHFFSSSHNNPNDPDHVEHR
jgi:U3 small nucleolar RNA-associated protein 21